MLVYRSAGRPVDARQELESIGERLLRCARGREPTHEEWVGLTIDAGVLEAALVDAENTECDRESALSRALRALSIALADGLVASWSGRRSTTGVVAAATRAWRSAREVVPAAEVVARVPEGYAYYGLYPETYGQAARAFVTEVAPARATVIGIRSIGTSLSAVVVAALRTCGVPASSVTVRPRGHPFDRYMTIHGPLAASLRTAASSPEHWFAVVDEGPGLSGSSFAAVAEELAALGARDDRIVLFPSWDPDPLLLRSDRARNRWRRHRRFTGDFDTLWVHSGRLSAPFGARVQSDISAGAWRDKLFASEADFPAVQPQHERRKFLCRDRETGDASLLKFEGLGRLGRGRIDCARELAQAGLAAPVRGFANGFLATDWVDGTPLTTADVCAGFLVQVADYVAWRQRHARTRPDIALPALLEMMRVNVGEALGADQVRHLEPMSLRIETIARAPAVRIDGRMAPHEWLRTASGYVKTDGISHHDDHFYPGPQDAAWDLAGAAIELCLVPDELRLLVARYATGTGDDGVAERLPFWRVAYLSFRVGYATLAAGALAGSPDGARMAQLASRYRDQLARALPDDGASATGESCR